MTLEFKCGSLTVSSSLKCGMTPRARHEVRRSKFAKGLAHRMTSIDAKKSNRILFHHLLIIRLNRLKLLVHGPKTVERQQHPASHILRALLTAPPEEPVDLKTGVKCFPGRLAESLSLSPDAYPEGGSVVDEDVVR